MLQASTLFVGALEEGRQFQRITLRHFTRLRYYLTCQTVFMWKGEE